MVGNNHKVLVGLAIAQLVVLLIGFVWLLTTGVFAPTGPYYAPQFILSGDLLDEGSTLEGSTRQGFIIDHDSPIYSDVYLAPAGPPTFFQVIYDARATIAYLNAK